MEAEDPLSQLRDIHLPEPVTSWPFAPGWWVLLILLIIGLVFLWRHAIADVIQKRRLASTLGELQAALERYKTASAEGTECNQAGLDYLATVNTLLKRLAQVRYPQAGTAHMTGSEWLAFLDSCDESSAFRQGPGAPLGDGVYRREFDADVEALQALAKTWIENRYTAQAGDDDLGRTAA